MLYLKFKTYVRYFKFNWVLYELSAILHTLTRQLYLKFKTLCHTR